MHAQSTFIHWITPDPDLYWQRNIYSYTTHHTVHTLTMDFTFCCHAPAGLGQTSGHSSVRNTQWTSDSGQRSGRGQIMADEWRETETRRHGDTPIVSCQHIVAGQHQHVDMYYRSDQTEDVFFIVYSGCSEDGCNVLYVDYVENCEVGSCR